MSKQPETIVPFEASRRYVDISRDSRHIFNAHTEVLEVSFIYFSEAVRLLTDKLGRQQAKAAPYKDATTGYNDTLQRFTYETIDRFLPMLLQLTPQTVYEVRSAVERYDQVLLTDPTANKREAGRKVTAYILGFLNDLERF